MFGIYRISTLTYKLKPQKLEVPERKRTMLFQYSLENFKAFSKPDPLSIRPITLIFGQNSSGKSSILQSLLLIKQSIEEAENPETLLLPKGNLVDLGGYREFIHRHDVKQPFSFKLIIDTEESPFRFPSFIENGGIKLKYVGLQVQMKYDEISSNALLDRLTVFVEDFENPLVTLSAEKSKEVQSPQFGYGIGPASSKFSLRTSFINWNHPFWVKLWNHYQSRAQQTSGSLQKRQEFLRKRISDGRIEKTSELKRRERELKSVEETIAKLSNFTFETACAEFKKVILRQLISCFGFIPTTVNDSGESESMFDALVDERWTPGQFKPNFVAGLLLNIGFSLRQFIENTIYIGPLRDYPERHYIYSGNLSDHVGKTGKMVPDVLFKNPEVLNSVNRQLERFNLRYELKVRSSGNDEVEMHDVFALRLVDKGTNVSASILDVGFGISQVLPIVVQAMLSKKKTLLIEQPEIHLHPRLQADLGSLLAECIKTPYENRFIVETHSQHMMLRIQNLIKNRTISNKDVSVIYVDRTDDGSDCLELRLDEEGDFIDQWPQGFFEEGYREIFRKC
jgi:AAA15 family ATPase/GTPase